MDEPARRSAVEADCPRSGVPEADGAPPRYTPAVKSFALIATIALTTACVDPLTNRPVNTPEWEAKNVKAYGETVAGLPPDTVLGCDLVVAGEVARWRECAAVDSCGQIERSRPAKDLLAVEHVGQTSIEERQVEVLKLSLTARPGYVVPYSPAPR